MGMSPVNFDCTKVNPTHFQPATQTRRQEYTTAMSSSDLPGEIR